MSRFGFTKQVTTLLDGTSANSSVRTSSPYWVGDSQEWILSYSTTTGVASVLSIQGSISDGFLSALTSIAAPNPDWKTIGGQATDGFYTQSVSTFPIRWIRVVRAAADSQASVTVTARIY